MVTTAKSVAVAKAKKAVAPTPASSRSGTVPAGPVVVKVPAKRAIAVAVQPKAEKPIKVKKPKLVRDSFTIPKAEYAVLDELKLRAGKLASSAKKSELIRAGIKALAAMSDSAFEAALKAVPVIKTGRPTKTKAN